MLIARDFKGDSGNLDHGEPKRLRSFDEPRGLFDGDQVGADDVLGGRAVIGQDGQGTAREVRQGLTAHSRAAIGTGDVRIKRGALRLGADAEHLDDGRRVVRFEQMGFIAKPVAEGIGGVADNGLAGTFRQVGEQRRVTAALGVSPGSRLSLARRTDSISARVPRGDVHIAGDRLDPHRAIELRTRRLTSPAIGLKSIAGSSVPVHRGPLNVSVQVIGS